MSRSSSSSPRATDAISSSAASLGGQGRPPSARGVASFGAYQNIVNGNFEHAAADTAIATGAGVTALSLLVPISTPVVVAALLVGAAGVLAKALLGEPEDPDVEDARAQFVAAGEQALH